MRGWSRQRQDTILFETIYEDRYPAANQLLGINPHNFIFSQVGHS